MAKAVESVVVIIPTYNERGNIGRLIDVLTGEVFPKLGEAYRPQILVVDDSSPDGTAAEVKEKERGGLVTLLINRRKGGLGRAYITGMEHALEKMGADIVFEMDADFSHDPLEVPEFLARLAEGNDMVLGSRYISGGSIPDNWAFHRKFLSVMGNFFIRVVITHFAIRDWTTGYRAIRRRVVAAVLPELKGERFQGYSFQIGFLHKTIRKGFRVAEVPIKFVDRELGHSKLGTEYIKNNLYYIFRVRAGELIRNRLFKFAVVGVIGAVVQLTTLQLFRMFLGYNLAYFLSTEMAVLSNFIWSNIWTFADRQLTWTQVPLKFVQFNMASAGSILIQQVFAWVMARYVGLFDLFTLPVVGITIDTGIMYAVIGIFIGMFWNFFAYSRFIWKAKGKPAATTLEAS
jgi:dolichol-phosphate mannosyltransferase